MITTFTARRPGPDRLFIDTAGFIALIWDGDSRHREAATFYRETANRPKVTTNLVVSETFSRLRYAASHSTAMRFLKIIHAARAAGQLQLIWSDEVLERKAETFLEGFADQDLSYVDAVSFAVIKAEGIKDAFTFDRHFYLIGCNVLPD